MIDTLQPIDSQPLRSEEAKRVMELARTVLQIEADAVRMQAKWLNDTFIDALNLLLHTQGRVVVSGIGKSGHIARKIAATLASTGTPAFFMHPAEATHGDLGMMTRQDVMIAISHSGESHELLTIVPLLKRHGSPLITITGNPASTLAREATVHLHVRIEKEACPLGLAPTASTTATLALGDALALALLDLRGFNAEDFARTHPGGALGRRLLIRVSDIMRHGDALPHVQRTAPLREALLEMSRKGLGLTAITQPDGTLEGIYTDGDLRRTLDKEEDIRGVTIGEVMTPSPHTISSHELAATAVALMEEKRITALLVTDEQNRLLGALNMHDLMRAGVV
ncbi:MAG: KpsF/GutQ family sugar-phosphate isomerase [Proteobacteria bacterium]|nr:KpsF/GutQ family sugar-phosphate isomerase [Pseudomonadota bacterium]MDE3207681.1 KpsF/GutQ family sugar-phosphate isomerase [Pseudomonadota bacterium]